MLRRAELKALHQRRMVPKAGQFLSKFASGLLIMTQKRSRQSWRFFARNFPRLTLLCMNLQAIATATFRNLNYRHSLLVCRLRREKQLASGIIFAALQQAV